MNEEAPRVGSIVVATYRRPDYPEVERVFLRTDRDDAPPAGNWWLLGQDTVAEPFTWEEVCGLDNPADDRSSVMIDVYAWRTNYIVAS